MSVEFRAGRTKKSLYLYRGLKCLDRILLFFINFCIAKAVHTLTEFSNILCYCIYLSLITLSFKCMSVNSHIPY